MPHASRPTAPAPSVDSLVALADRCVQCGLCLPACPTYAHGRLEAESPRGRIALARAWALDTIAPTPVGDAHLDHCLGCRSCEAVCPAGVEYGALLVAARTRQRARRAAPLRQRLLETLAARPRLLAVLLRLYRAAFGGLPRALRVLPRPPTPAEDDPAMHATRRGAAPAPASAALPAAALPAVALFTGCVARAYEPPVRAALARLCAAAGFRLAVPAGQGCCGSLHAHAGNPAATAALAAVNRAAFHGQARALTLASGCHEAVAGALDLPTSDALTFLDEHRARLRFRPLPERVALHLPCTQRNVARSTEPLRRLLAAVPRLELVMLDAGAGCCGAAGSQMLTDPARAAGYRAPLLDQLAASGATRLLSANLGCRLHLANGAAIAVQHPLELLAEALAPGPPA